MTAAMTMERTDAARAVRGAEPLRRCIATGIEAPRRHLVRFVRSPDGVLTPDVAGRLPGRGAWLRPDRGAIAEAVKRRLFNRAFGGPVAAPENLAAAVELLLVQRMVDTLGLARRAGQAVSGNEKCEEWLASGRAALALLARDAGADARRRRSGQRQSGQRQSGQRGDLALIDTLSAEEIGRAFARPHAVHAVVAKGELQRRLIDDSIRLAGLRPMPGDEREPESA